MRNCAAKGSLLTNQTIVLRTSVRVHACPCCIFLQITTNRIMTSTLLTQRDWRWFTSAKLDPWPWTWLTELRHDLLQRLPLTGVITGKSLQNHYACSSKNDPSNINPHVMTPPCLKLCCIFLHHIFTKIPTSAVFICALYQTSDPSDKWIARTMPVVPSLVENNGKPSQPEKKMQRECQKNMSKNCWTNIPCQSMFRWQFSETLMMELFVIGVDIYVKNVSFHFWKTRPGWDMYI